MNHRAAINHNQVKKALENKSRWYRPREGDRVVQCGCGAVYTLESWMKLENIGRSSMPPEPGEPPYFEYHNCGCKSTLGMFLDDAGHPVMESRPRVETIVELGKIADRAGHVTIPRANAYKGKPVSARSLMTLRGTELEMLFQLGIEEVV